MANSFVKKSEKDSIKKSHPFVRWLDSEDCKIVSFKEVISNYYQLLFIFYSHKQPDRLVLLRYEGVGCILPYGQSDSTNLS